MSAATQELRHRQKEGLIAPSEPLLSEKKADQPHDNKEAAAEGKKTRKGRAQQRRSALQFKARYSYFDTSATALSSIQTSEFRGFFNLAVVVGIFFVLGSNTRNIILTGTLVGLEALAQLIPLWMLPIWLTMLTFNFGIVLICKLRLYLSSPLGNLLSWVLYSLHQSIMLVGSIYVLTTSSFPMVPSGTLTLEMVIFMMKAHSYFVTNIEFESLPDECDADPQDSDEEDDSNEVVEPNNGMRLKREKPIRFPDNVTFSNYLMFLCFPTLVYELNYPRTAKIRWGYVLEKCISAVGVFSILHIITTHYITPMLAQVGDHSLLEVVSALIVPFIFAQMLIFFIMFDLITNGFAEITRFADRYFYYDWWNSTTFDEYARKWNRPVHEWLLRHVYLKSLESFKTSKFSASLLTFFFSSVIHEMICAVLLGKVRPWLFFFQMSQVPLIYIGRFLKGTRAGNMFFWFGLVLGPPLITILYCREYVLALSPEELLQFQQRLNPSAF
ncbi:Sterol O-acyltransferase 2 (Sterol-ester synthase 2) [Balamuthia mandrillaris]